ncbi:MAG: substrate-binding domain-containing protein, partial [bacterium]
MKRFILLTVMATLLPVTNATAGDIYWYLAVSMAKPGREVVARFNEQADGDRVLLILGGSGQLLSKIELARQGDFYTPASDDFLIKASEKGLVQSQRLLLYQKPVFGVSRAGHLKIRAFSDLYRPGVRLALGNANTMALGAAYLQIEERMGRSLAGRIRANSQLEAINISQIVNYLRADVVDAGIIFDTVARANRLDYVEIPESYNSPIGSYFIRLVFSTGSEASLERFETFLFQQTRIFAKHGFQLV